MPLHRRAPLLDDLLETWRVPLGADHEAYRHHCYRVLNFCLAFSGEGADTMSKVCVAVAFHDLGIWTDHTYDYLEPSRRLARAHLAGTGRGAWAEEIEAMILQHHRIRADRTRPGWLVEPFRKADWIDVSRGVLRFGLPRAFVRGVLAAFPNAGFHRRLIDLTLQRIKTHPWSPLPMLRL